MRVKMAQQVSGLVNLGGKDGGVLEPWPAPGEVVDLPDDEAKSLLANGMAVDPKDKSVDTDKKEV